MPSAKVLVTRRLLEPVLDRLRRHAEVDLWEGAGVLPREELLRRVHGARAVLTLLTERVDDEVLEAAGPSLKLVANYAVGLDNIDVPACTARGVLVSNTPDVLAESTADMAWALLLAAARNVALGDRFLRSREPWVWDPRMQLGVDVHHKTLGVVGLGSIGRAMARRAVGFGMRVLYVNRHRAPSDIERALNATRCDLPTLLSEADFVSLHTPLTAETRHLIGVAELGRMKTTAVLVNTSRGPVVDEAALATALADGTIAAAGLDVFEAEPTVHPALLDLENVVLAPHLGSATHETREAMGMLAVDNIVAVLAGRRPPTLVNPDALATTDG